MSCQKLFFLCFFLIFYLFNFFLLLLLLKQKKSTQKFVRVVKLLSFWLSARSHRLLLNKYTIIQRFCEKHSKTVADFDKEINKAGLVRECCFFSHKYINLLNVYICVNWLKECSAISRAVSYRCVNYRTSS
jgi:hypothetical protein